MANTFTLIEAQTLSSSQASITLGSGGTIPQTYTDLKVVISSRNADTVEGAFCRFNSDSGTNYEWIQLKGTGSSAVSNKAVSFGSPYTTGVYWRSDISSQTANTFASTDIYLPNYTDSSTYQSASVDSVTENNATAAEATVIAGIWNNNAAVTSISFVTEGGGNFVAGSTFYLYGIKNS